MEHYRKRRRRNSNRNLLLLACVLAVLLIVAIVVAVALRPHSDGSSGTGSTAGSGGSTGGTSGTVGADTPQDLVLQSPRENRFATVEKVLVFAGTADPEESLSINGQLVSVSAEGEFSHQVELNPGENEISVIYQGETVVYYVEYRYATEFFEPADSVQYNSGATIQLSVSARAGSQVQAQLNGKTISMKESVNQAGSGVAEGFVLYTGTYSLPDDNTQELALGIITYTVTCDGITETYQSGQISCLATTRILTSDPSVTPDYGEYTDVGSGYIVEVITGQAETFDGKTTDDNSSPLRNYLPEGTVDYASTTVIKNSSASYMLLRCGRRVYVSKNNWPSKDKVTVVDCYVGTLPDHNEVGFVSMEEIDHFTVLTLDVLWKAPFYFDLEPQSYNNPSTRDFRVSEVTAEYVDITFCYATVFEGTVTIPADNPLFSSAVLTQNESDCTLRLYLKKTGGFYGWDSYYNENDQLCFKFLNPVSATASDNAYGADLTGIRIMIDVGHGGGDGGSPAVNAAGQSVEESDLNLKLALILKEELERMGATVILNREDDSALNTDERIGLLKETWPDVCISIHQNAYSGSASVSGAQVCYSTPFSQPLAKLIYAETVESGIYQKTSTSWHYYFVARQTNCPVVLMENGYMTNAGDLAGMQDENVLMQKAQSMARAVADYFLQIGQ